MPGNSWLSNSTHICCQLPYPQTDCCWNWCKIIGADGRFWVGVNFSCLPSMSWSYLSSAGESSFAPAMNSCPIAYFMLRVTAAWSWSFCSSLTRTALVRPSAWLSIDDVGHLRMSHADDELCHALPHVSQSWRCWISSSYNPYPWDLPLWRENERLLGSVTDVGMPHQTSCAAKYRFCREVQTDFAFPSVPSSSWCNFIVQILTAEN